MQTQRPSTRKPNADSCLFGERPEDSGCGRTDWAAAATAADKVNVIDGLPTSTYYSKPCTLKKALKL